MMIEIAKDKKAHNNIMYVSMFSVHISKSLGEKSIPFLK